MERKNLIWTIVLVIFTVIITVGITEVKNFGIFGPEKAVGIVVELNYFLNNDVVLGVDINNDLKADIKVHTNAVSASDIMQKCCQWSDGKSDGFLTEIRMFSPVKIKAWRCVVSNGNFWERNIPQYIFFGYEDDLLKSKTTAQN